MPDPDRISDLWNEYSPRIAAARKREAEEGNAVFVELNEERIGEFPAILLTIERFLLLQQAGVFDGSCGEERAVILFLWIVNPDFEANPKKGKRFFRKHRKIDALHHANEIDAYVARQFGQQASSAENSRSSWVASIVDAIASEYGWSEKDILKSPIQRLMRYVSAMRIRHGSSSVNFGSEVDRLQQEFMQKANEVA